MYWMEDQSICFLAYQLDQAWWVEGGKRKRKYVTVIAWIIFCCHMEFNWFFFFLNIRSPFQCYLFYNRKFPFLHPSTSRRVLFSPSWKVPVVLRETFLPFLSLLDAVNRALFLWGWDPPVGRCTGSSWVLPSSPEGQVCHSWVLQKLWEERDWQPHQSYWVWPDSTQHPVHPSTVPLI